MKEYEEKLPDIMHVLKSQLRRICVCRVMQVIDFRSQCRPINFKGDAFCIF